MRHPSIAYPQKPSMPGWPLRPGRRFQFRLKKENEELKQIIGIMTLELERGKKIEIIKGSTNRKLIASCMQINHKNIYFDRKKEVKDQEVKTRIEDTFLSHPAYGHRLLAIELEMNRKKILRVMHKYGLRAPRLWCTKKFTTQSDSKMVISCTNLLKKLDMNSLGIGDVWSTDLTYIKFQEKFIYLSIIQDIVSKEVVGFNLSFHHNGELVLKTIKEAVLKTGRLPRIFHSDRGTENLAQICTNYLEANGVQVSVSRFSRFKGESGNLQRFETLGELI